MTTTINYPVITTTADTWATITPTTNTWAVHVTWTGTNFTGWNIAPFAPSLQHIIDNAVRMLTTGNGEEKRLLEASEFYIEAFERVALRDLPADVVPSMCGEFRRLLMEPGDWFSNTFNGIIWEINCEKLLAILQPHISKPDLYYKDYEKWERELEAA